VKSDGTRIIVFGTNEGKLYKLVAGAAVEAGQRVHDRHAVGNFATYGDLPS